MMAKPKVDIVGLLSEAYERLLSAYQEAREINDELEKLIKNALTN